MADAHETPTDIAARLVPTYIVEGIPASGDARFNADAAWAEMEAIRPGSSGPVRAWLFDSLAGQEAVPKADLRDKIAKALAGPCS